MIDRIEDLGLDGLWIEPYPSVSKWLYNAQQRTATNKSYFHGSRLSDQFPDLVKGSGSLSDWTNDFFKARSDKD